MGAPGPQGVSRGGASCVHAGWRGVGRRLLPGSLPQRPRCPGEGVQGVHVLAEDVGRRLVDGQGRVGSMGTM